MTIKPIKINHLALTRACAKPDIGEKIRIAREIGEIKSDE